MSLRMSTNDTIRLLIVEVTVAVAGSLSGQSFWMIVSLMLNAGLLFWMYNYPGRPLPLRGFGKADLAKWGSRDRFRIWEAAFLWHDREPVPTERVAEYYDAAIQLTHREIDDAYVNNFFKDVDLKYDINDRKKVVAHLIPRSELERWAMSRNEKPVFLFPAEDNGLISKSVNFLKSIKLPKL